MSVTAEAVSFYDRHPKPADFYREVMEGLTRSPRAIPPKFFYDETGSRLFDAICDTPEYYPTRTEMAILEQHVDEIANLVGPNCLLVEPGAGSTQKVRILLEAVRPEAYMPMDISKDYLREAAQELAADFPWLEVHAACADFTQPLDLPYTPPGVPRVAFFPGSSIGNFEPQRAVAFLANIARMVGPGGGLLIGVDLKKDPSILYAAYNDTQGITAAFNLNLLNRINNELDGDFDPQRFEHRAFYNETEGRIEMHLVSREEQTVRVDNARFAFNEGEGIHTENSYKYGIEEFQAMARQAGFEPVATWTDAERLFSVHYFRIP